jgi:hypothetical protein
VLTYIFELAKVTKVSIDLKTNNLAINNQEPNIFADIDYICNSTSLIVDSLQRGLDVAQLPTGDVIVTEVRTINTQYSWDQDKQRMVKVGQN